MSALGKQINSDDILREFVTGVLLDTQTIIFFCQNMICNLFRMSFSFHFIIYI